MNRYPLAAIVVSLLLLSACGQSGDGVPPPQFAVTLTGIVAVKQGSNEGVPIDGTPVDGATLTVSP